MTNEVSDPNVWPSPRSWAATSIANIPRANSTYESPTYPGCLVWPSNYIYSETTLSKQPNDFHLASEEEREAQVRSEAAKQHWTELQFAELFWSLEWVLLWIAFRDPGRFGEDFLRAMFRANAYGKTSKCDNNPRRTLLRALQSGSFKAIKNGAPLTSEAWAGATERRWPADIWFRREDILKQWPSPPSGNTAEVERPRSTVKLKGEALIQAIRDAIKEAIGRQTAMGGKKLNGKQQVTEAMKILRLQGVEAPALRSRVEEIADAEFKGYRNRSGVTLKSLRAKH